MKDARSTARQDAGTQTRWRLWVGVLILTGSLASSCGSDKENRGQVPLPPKK